MEFTAQMLFNIIMAVVGIGAAVVAVIQTNANRALAESQGVIQKRLADEEQQRIAIENKHAREMTQMKSTTAVIENLFAQQTTRDEAHAQDRQEMTAAVQGIADIVQAFDARLQGMAQDVQHTNTITQRILDLTDTQASRSEALITDLQTLRDATKRDNELLHDEMQALRALVQAQVDAGALNWGANQKLLVRLDARLATIIQRIQATEATDETIIDGTDDGRAASGERDADAGADGRADERPDGSADSDERTP